jgi:hypothetical protein
MSEYPMTRHTPARKPASPEAPALFDDLDDAVFKDEEVDRVVDTRNVSYDVARRIVGVDERSYETPKSAGEGASVELGARALALHNIMDAYNQLNKTMGARISSQYADSSFASRYTYPDEVMENMGRKGSQKLHAIESDFATLVDRDELLEQGFSSEAVNRAERELRKGLLDKYGPGKAYAKDRAAVVKRAERAARAGSKASNK